MLHALRSLGRFRLLALVAAMVGALQLLSVCTSMAAAALPPGVPVWIGPLVLGAFQWAIAYALKKHEGVVNGVIGWVTLILSFVGYAVVPKEANAGFVLAESLGVVKGLGIGLAAVLQTAIVTGIHEWILGSFLKPLIGRSSKSTSYLPPA